MRTTAIRQDTNFEAPEPTDVCSPLGKRAALLTLLEDCSSFFDLTPARFPQGFPQCS